MFRRFDKNDSSTSIAYKKYDKTPKDKYPTFSICLRGPKIHSYNNSATFRAYGITSDQYRLMLMGTNTSTYHYNPASRSYTKSPIIMKTASKVNFQNMVQRNFELTDILLEAKFVRKGNNDTTYYSQTSKEKLPLYISYEHKDIICFTRKSQYISMSPRDYDDLVLSFSKPLKMMTCQISCDATLEIFIHYPGQLQRSLGRPSFSIPASRLFNYFYANYNLNFKLTQGTVVRYRPDSNEPCNEEIDDYDAYMQAYITTETGCVHPFWKTNSKFLMHHEECKSPEKLKTAINLIKTYNEKSCVEMYNSVLWEKQQKKVFQFKAHIRFKYVDDYYQEIVYLKSFGKESLISNLGGFIGIFLGYSLMQVPELLGRYKD